VGESESQKFCEPPADPMEPPASGAGVVVGRESATSGAAGESGSAGAADAAAGAISPVAMAMLATIGRRCRRMVGPVCFRCVPVR
jgi:hypothetical protein